VQTKRILTRDDIEEYDAVILDLMILLDPCTPNEVREFNIQCERIWLELSRNRRDKSNWIASNALHPRVKRDNDNIRTRC
jgi:hypothetical protein